MSDTHLSPRSLLNAKADMAAELDTISKSGPMTKAEALQERINDLVMTREKLRALLFDIVGEPSSDEKITFPAKLPLAAMLDNAPGALSSIRADIDDLICEIRVHLF